MPKHVYVAYHLWAHRKWRIDQLEPLSAVNGNVDTLRLMHDWLAGLEEAALRDDETEQILRVDGLELDGRTLRMNLSHGRFGVAGEMMDVITGAVTHEYSEYEAPITELRNLLVIPEGEQHGIFLAERLGIRGVWGQVRWAFNRAFREATDDEVTLKYSGMTNVADYERFMDESELKQVIAYRYESSRDLADHVAGRGVERVPHDTLMHSRRPPRGQWLSKAIKDGLLGKTITPQSVVDIPPDYEVESTALVLESEGQQRTIVIDRDKQPTFAFELADDGEDRPDDDTFYAAAFETAVELLRALHVDLPADWDGS